MKYRKSRTSYSFQRSTWTRSGRSRRRTSSQRRANSTRSYVSSSSRSPSRFSSSSRSPAWRRSSRPPKRTSKIAEFWPFLNKKTSASSSTPRKLNLLNLKRNPRLLPPSSPRSARRRKSGSFKFLSSVPSSQKSRRPPRTTIRSSRRRHVWLSRWKKRTNSPSNKAMRSLSLPTSSTSWLKTKPARIRMWRRSPRKTMNFVSRTNSSRPGSQSSRSRQSNQKTMIRTYWSRRPRSRHARSKKTSLCRSPTRIRRALGWGCQESASHQRGGLRRRTWRLAVTSPGRKHRSSENKLYQRERT